MNAWSQTYPLSEGAGLRVRQASGPVTIVAGDTREVKVTATCKDDVDLQEYIEAGSTATGIQVEIKARRWLWAGVPSIRLDIEVPRGTSCNVESGSGSVEISATGAPVQIETGSGSVKVAEVGHTTIETGSGMIQGWNVDGSVSAETGSGMVEFARVNGSLTADVGSGAVNARQINGDLRVDTGSGALVAEDVNGRVELDTGGGSVVVQRVRGGSLTVDTGGGPIQLKAIDVTELEVDTGSGSAEVELAQVYPGGSYQVNTGYGGIVVALPPTADVRLRAEASSGRIVRTGLDFRVVHEDAGELEAVLNQGRAEMVLEAGSGGIRLVPLQGAPAAPQTGDGGLSEAGARIVEAVKDDPAVESSEQLRRILAMVEEGKLTPEEALELLRALDEEEPA